MKHFIILITLVFCTISGWSQKSTLNDTSSKDLVDKIKKQLDSSSKYYNKGDYAKSIEINTNLLDLTIKLNDPYYLTRNYRSLAYNFLVLKDTVLAKENFDKARTYAELQNSDLALGKSYMDIANYYTRVDTDYDKILSYHKKAIQQMRLVEDSIFLASAYYNGNEHI